MERLKRRGEPVDQSLVAYRYTGCSSDAVHFMGGEYTESPEATGLPSFGGCLVPGRPRSDDIIEGRKLGQVGRPTWSRFSRMEIAICPRQPRAEGTGNWSAIETRSLKPWNFRCSLTSNCSKLQRYPATPQRSSTPRPSNVTSGSLPPRCQRGHAAFVPLCRVGQTSFPCDRRACSLSSPAASAVRLRLPYPDCQRWGLTIGHSPDLVCAVGQGEATCEPQTPSWDTHRLIRTPGAHYRLSRWSGQQPELR